MTKRKSQADAWENQAVTTFGDGAEIAAGIDYLRTNPVKIDGIPNGLIHYWANPEDDLTDRHYFRADPQPNHEMTRRGMVLWLTRKDIYEKRKGTERAMANKAVETAGDLQNVRSQGGKTFSRKGRDSMRND